ncbi:MAG TPA: EAL domain-containing protein [Dongiaceae bacterium]|nr:EAL domain-containing protein [Dongiaceae bacterium]
MLDVLNPLKRLMHIHHFLRDFGKQAPNCETRTDLFETLCRLAVERGRYRMAWVGILHGDQIVPVAAHGDGEQLIRQSKLVISEGQHLDPVCRAIHDNVFCVINDVDRHAATPPWFEDIKALGVKSIAVLPVQFKQKVVGILALYSEEENDFSDLYTFSLEELGDDIAIALEQMDEYTSRIDLELQLKQLHQAVECSATAVIITDNKGYIQYVNPYYGELSGYDTEDVLGTNVIELKAPDVPQIDARELYDSLNANNEWRGELLIKTSDGQMKWTYQHISAIRDKQGDITHFVSTAIDHTELHFAQETIEKLAYYDELTGLPNRRLFYDRIQQAINSAERDEAQFSVFYLDLDGFKNINDSLGHSAGDLLLKTVARRLRQQVRAKDTVARLGGDEFTIIVTDVKETRDITIVAENVIRALAQPVDIGDKPVVITTSIGIAVFPGDGNSIDRLTRNADLAMYHAKARGKNNFQFFTEELNRRVQERMALELRLREAFQEQQFKVEFQPQVDAADGTVVAVETLIAWDGRKQGMLTRAHFMRTLEECGMIDDVFEWLLTAGGRQCAQLMEQNGQRFRVAFGVPATLFRNAAKLYALLERSLSFAGLDYRQVQLEIPEAVISDDIGSSLKILRELRKRGVTVAIDNFGMGFSSLRYLRRFRVDIIKVDGAFVRDVLSDENDAAVTSAIIALAHQLDLKVLAEGVDSLQHAQFLERYWCDFLQGNYIARSLDRAALATFLQSRHQHF